MKSFLQILIIALSTSSLYAASFEGAYSEFLNHFNNNYAHRGTTKFVDDIIHNYGDVQHFNIGRDIGLFLRDATGYGDFNIISDHDNYVHTQGYDKSQAKTNRDIASAHIAILAIIYGCVTNDVILTPDTIKSKKKGDKIYNKKEDFIDELLMGLKTPDGLAEEEYLEHLDLIKGYFMLGVKFYDELFNNFNWKAFPYARAGTNTDEELKNNNLGESDKGWGNMIAAIKMMHEKGQEDDLTFLVDENENSFTSLNGKEQIKYSELLELLNEWMESIEDKELGLNLSKISVYAACKHNFRFAIPRFIDYLWDKLEKKGFYTKPDLSNIKGRASLQTPTKIKVYDIDETTAFQKSKDELEELADLIGVPSPDEDEKEEEAWTDPIAKSSESEEYVEETPLKDENEETKNLASPGGATEQRDVNEEAGPYEAPDDELNDKNDETSEETAESQTTTKSENRDSVTKNTLSPDTKPRRIVRPSIGELQKRKLKKASDRKPRKPAKKHEETDILSNAVSKLGENLGYSSDEEGHDDDFFITEEEKKRKEEEEKKSAKLAEMKNKKQLEERRKAADLNIKAEALAKKGKAEHKGKSGSVFSQLLGVFKGGKPSLKKARNTILKDKKLKPEKAMKVENMLMSLMTKIATSSEYHYEQVEEDSTTKDDEWSD